MTAVEPQPFQVREAKANNRTTAEPVTALGSKISDFLRHILAFLIRFSVYPLAAFCSLGRIEHALELSDLIKVTRTTPQNELCHFLVHTLSGISQNGVKSDNC